MERAEAENLLKTAVDDPLVQFRQGQWEAIDTIVNKRRKLLVVQRTGWGKSSVYFISARILRDNGSGPTLIVSPLLALMRNQIAAAERLGIRAETINSSNRDDWDKVIDFIYQDEVDALLISPERLANEGFIESVLIPIADRIGMLVVDEAHCISDWGHDFRPDYRRLVNIIRQMPPNMPVLGTTATANDRVIDDIQQQLGDIDVQRGELARDSLSLHTLRLPNRAARLAWLAQYIPKLPGTGIVYALTIRDAELVADWLFSQGIEARAYHSRITGEDFPDSSEYRQHLEDMLLDNRIKVLVATTALGMGYDKPDLGFVIHYQAPSSVVAYYQQVGRAGRAIDRAFGVLFSGDEDSDIHEFFRRSAFPDADQVQLILEALERSDGLSVPELERRVDLRRSRIDHVLKFLSVDTPSPVARQSSRWYRSPVQYRMDLDRIKRLTRQREIEWQEIQEYIASDSCLMAYLRNALNDPATTDCGRCSVCLGRRPSDAAVSQELGIAASVFLRRSEMPITPRVIVPAGALESYGLSGNLRTRGLAASDGRVLSTWRDAGWGDMVASDKNGGRFRDELVEAVAEMYESRWNPQPAPRWVACVPSHNQPTLVSDFARRLAVRLNLPFMDVIRKAKRNRPQKEQENSFHQCGNLDGVFNIAGDIPKSPVLLVDDIVDSGWTLTVLAALLRQSGSGEVFPVALASTTPGG